MYSALANRLTKGKYESMNICFSNEEELEKYYIDNVYIFWGELIKLPPHIVDFVVYNYDKLYKDTYWAKPKDIVDLYYYCSDNGRVYIKLKFGEVL